MKTTSQVLKTLNRLGGKVTVVDINDAYDMRYVSSANYAFEFQRAVNELSTALKARKDVVEVYVESGNLFVVGTICRQFKSLNDYLVKYAHTRTLGIHEIRTEELTGKRTSTWTEGVTLLAHNANACDNIKKWLRKNKTSKDSVQISTSKRTDYGEDYEAFIGEREYGATMYHFAKIRVYTPSGRIKAETYVEVY